MQFGQQAKVVNKPIISDVKKGANVKRL